MVAGCWGPSVMLVVTQEWSVLSPAACVWESLPLAASHSAGKPRRAFETSSLHWPLSLEENCHGVLLRLLARAIRDQLAVEPPKPAPDSCQWSRPASTRQMLRLKRRFLPSLARLRGQNRRLSQEQVLKAELQTWGCIQDCYLCEQFKTVLGKRKLGKHRSLCVPEYGFNFQLLFATGHGFFRVGSALEQGLIPSYFLQMLCRSLMSSVDTIPTTTPPQQTAEIKGVLYTHYTVTSWDGFWTFATVVGVCIFLRRLSGAQALWWAHMACCIWRFYEIVCKQLEWYSPVLHMG